MAFERIFCDRRASLWDRAACGAALVAGVLGLLSSPAAAHQAEPKAGAEPMVAPANPGTRDARTYFTDTELLTQDGKPVRFYSDVLQDRVVLINVVYTHCEDACPLITKKLNEVRAKLDEPAARAVWFVSISTDPERDSPQALKKFAAAQGVKDANWVFLTGKKANVDHVLGRLGQMSPSAEEHSTLLIAGNVGAKRWSKIRPDAPVAAIVERLKVLVGNP